MSKTKKKRNTCLVLDTAGLHLVCEYFGTGLLSFGLVDVFHKDTLVFEDVTLGFLVQGVVPKIRSRVVKKSSRPF
jgi:hypothetical protein